MYRENMLECSAWYKRYALNGRRKEDIATLYLNISYVRKKILKKQIEHDSIIRINFIKCILLS